MHKRNIYLGLWVLLLGILAVISVGAADHVPGAVYESEYEKLLKQTGPEALALDLLDKYHTPEGPDRVESAGILLAKQPDLALKVLDAMAQAGADDSEMLEAHLLLEIAIGPDAGVVKRYSYRNKKHFLTDAMSERAARLLSHDDPIVRAMAEWALAVRVAKDNEKKYMTWGAPRATREWPKENPPEWFQKWYAIPDSQLLELDYGRQMIDAGIHTDYNAMLEAAAGIVDRAKKAAAEGNLQSEEYRKTLGAMQSANEALQASAESGLTGQRKAFIKLRQVARDVVMLNPDLDMEGLVYCTRHSGRKHLVPMSSRASDHAPGGDLHVQMGLDPDTPARSLVMDQLDPGHVQDYDLWYDADKIVFSWSEQTRWDEGTSGLVDGLLWDCGAQPLHLWEINIDGTGLRQLTDHPRFGDMEPAYLPDGDIVFASGRSQGSTHCGSWNLNGYFSPPNLYRINPESKAIRRISYNKDEDRYPYVDNDGRIVYMRWDYQERGFGPTQPLWILNPDGTMNDGLYKMHTLDSPLTLRDPRGIPGDERYIAIACGHHEHIEGALAIVDPNTHLNDTQAMEYVTPDCSPTEGGYGPARTVAQGGVQDRYGLYHTPWALSPTSFLTSYAYGAPASTSFAAYYIDVWGNKELLKRDRIFDVAVPIPLKKRPKPPVIVSRPRPEKNYALTYVNDVYTDMEGIERGTIKYIRILERLQWFDDQMGGGTGIQYKPGTNYNSMFSYWTPGATRVIGTVPVEEDGSAYFKVPTNMAIWFQALDENLMEVRRMRTHVEYQPGEMRGCIGCHETQSTIPRTGADSRRLAAVLRKPSMPKPPVFGDTTLLDFENHIQPIFDKHCVECHGAEKPKGKLDLSRMEDEFGFMQSYRSIMGVKSGETLPMGFSGFVIDGVPVRQDKKVDREYYAARRNQWEFKPEGSLLSLPNWNINLEISQPRQCGSYQSPLIRTLFDKESHAKIREKFSPAEWEMLVTWVDVNAPYFSTHVRRDGHKRGKGNILTSVNVVLDPPFKKGEKGYAIRELDPKGSIQGWGKRQPETIKDVDASEVYKSREMAGE